MSSSVSSVNKYTKQDFHLIGYKEKYRNDAAVALCNAFWDDPVWKWMSSACKTEDERRKVEISAWKMILDTAKRTKPLGIILCKHKKYEKIAGAAVWYPPGDYANLLDMIGNGWLWKLPRLVGIKKTFGIMGVLGEVEDFHHLTMKGRAHFYLNYLGCDTTYQGCGLGGSLVRIVTEQADDCNLPCYLESSNPKNLGFYQHMGFKIIHTFEEFKSSPSFPTIFILIRENKNKSNPNHCDDLQSRKYFLQIYKQNKSAEKRRTYVFYAIILLICLIIGLKIYQIFN